MEDTYLQDLNDLLADNITRGGSANGPGRYFVVRWSGGRYDLHDREQNDDVVVTFISPLAYAVAAALNEDANDC